MRHSDDNDTTRATARLPGLEIEIVHRRPRDGVEALSINLHTTPSFEALGRFFEIANPLVFWAHALQMAWQPWIGATRAFTAPWNAVVLSRPHGAHPSANATGRRSDDQDAK